MHQLFDGFDREALKSILIYDQHNPLLFNTGAFLLLFLAFILIYQAIRRWHNAKMIFVILFSLYFYYKSSAQYCFILLGVCISDYVLGNILGAVKSRFWRKTVVCVNIITNVGMLVYFKYFNMLYETFANITNTSFDALDIILPAGISFFTFRSISYIVDIYRGEISPAKNFLEYTFFLTFFPPLLAGPVVRAKDMLPQIKQNPIATRAMVSEGLFLIMCGLVKKMVIADYISGNFVDRIFENPSLYSGVENLMGTVGFTLQIYCDFSGYSDMAIGLALLLGYRFKDNFRAPFKSQNPTEFWRRWHMSLSFWLRDYVYIPLGGNRKGKLRKHANLMTTMVIGGLWHGASWLYLVWGAYQGLLLSLHKTFTKIFPAPKAIKGSPAASVLNITFTFILTVIGFTIFRMAYFKESLTDSFNRLGSMATQISDNFHFDVLPQFIEAYLLIVLAIFAGLLIHFAPTSWTESLKRKYNAVPLVAQAVILALVLFFVIQARQSDLVPFVYLQY